MKKNIIVRIVTLTIITIVLIGCNSKKNINIEKPTVSISMYNSVSFPIWRTYIENECPDLHIEWKNNQNDITKLLYLSQHNNMPDIVAIRRFEEDSAAKLEPYLVDLSNTARAKSIALEYSRIFRKENNLYWLPQSGAIDTLVANKELFLQYNIPLPTDFDSFINACDAFEKVGIRGFMSAVVEKWGSSRILQCFGLSAFSSSEDYLAYMNNFFETIKKESCPKDFLKIIEKLNILKEHKILIESDLTNATQVNVSEKFFNKQVAMTIICSDAEFDKNSPLNLVSLPYFGKTEKENYIMSYPVFKIAVSKKVLEDKEKLKNTQRVLNIMTSHQAQKIMNEQGEGLISYSNQHLKLSPLMENITPYMNKNKNYIRILLEKTFYASKLCLQDVITTNLSREEIISKYFKNYTLKNKEIYIGTSQIEANNERTTPGTTIQSFNSPFASIVAQTIQNQLNTNIVLLDSKVAGAPLFKGDYTDIQIKSIIAPCPLYEGYFTGKEIKKAIKQSIISTCVFELGNIEPLISFPAIAGITVFHSSDNPVENCIFPDESGIEEDKIYKLTVDKDIAYALNNIDKANSYNFKECNTDVQTVFMEYWTSKKTLPYPVEYFKKVKE